MVNRTNDDEQSEIDRLRQDQQPKNIANAVDTDTNDLNLEPEKEFEDANPDPQKIQTDQQMHGELGLQDGTGASEAAKKEERDRILNAQKTARNATIITAATAAAQAATKALKGLDVLQREEHLESHELLEESSEALHELDQIMLEMKDNELELYSDQYKLETKLKELKADPTANPDEIKDLEIKLEELEGAQDAYIELTMPLEDSIKEVKHKEAELKTEQRALNERAETLEAKIEKEGLTDENKALQNELNVDREELNTAQAELAEKTESIKSSTSITNIFATGIGVENKSYSELEENLRAAKDAIDFQKKLDEDPSDSMINTYNEQIAIEKSNTFGVTLFDRDSKTDNLREDNTSLTSTKFDTDTDIASDDTDIKAPALEMDQDTFTQVQEIEVSLAEGNAISKEEFDAKCAEMKLSPEQIAKVEEAFENKSITIGEPESDVQNDSMAVIAENTAANTPNNGIISDAGPTQKIPEQGTPTQTCNGLDNTCFADSEQFKKTSVPGAEASYDKPVENRIEFAPGVSEDLTNAVENKKGDDTSSGGGADNDLEQEAQKLVAQQLHEQRMAQANEIKQQDLDPPENRMV